MPQPAEFYISQHSNDLMRRQAWKVWTIGLLVTILWLGLILVPPIAKANGAESISTPLYSFFNYICHQRVDRSFFIIGEKFGVCSRCFGVYLGLVFGFVLYPLWRKIDDVEPITRIWLFLSMIPIAVDWSLTIFGIWENTFETRLVTGLLLGIACSTYIVPAIVEISRNLASRRMRRTNFR